nr:hypothetical protein [Tanacetum cinerariifolium]
MPAGIYALAHGFVGRGVGNCFGGVHVYMNGVGKRIGNQTGSLWDAYSELITADIRGSDPDSPAPKPAKATKKSKPSAPKAAPVIKLAAAKASKSTSPQQPKPKPAPAKTQEKKCKLVTKTSDEPSPAKSSKPGLVTKRHKPTSSLSLVDKAVEESLKSVYDAHRGPLPPVVFREPDSRKFQSLPEVQGKGKEKRRTPAPTEPSGHAKSTSIYVELGHARSNPDNDPEPQPQLSPIFYAGPNLKHMDLEATDVSTQQNPEKMAEGFGDHFFNDKPSEAENEKTTVKTKAESMVSVTIHQDTSTIPPMTSSVIDLISRPNSPNDHRLLPATATATTTTTMTITTLPLPPLPRQGTTDSILIKRIAHEDHMMRYKALEKLMNRNHIDELLDDLAEARRKKKKDTIHRKHHLGLHLISHHLLYHQQSDQYKSTTALSSSKTAASAEYTAWTNTNITLKLYILSIHEDLHMDDDIAPDEQVHSFDDEDIKNAHIPKVTIQSDFFFNKYLDYLRYGTKVGKPALSISKIKAAYYPDVGLGKMVPHQMWFEEESKDKYGVQMIMRFNEIHKFSDDTLHRINVALEYRVKEFKVNRKNLSLNTMFWTRKDVDKSKEFMFAIQKRLKTRRIFCNLESFIGRRVREGDYRLLQRTE